MNIYILAIESSCDDTSASVSCNNEILSNVIANQNIHKNYGGVVPELASRAHQQNIIPVVYTALSEAKIHKNQLHAIAFTRGPGLLGSLLVGSSFAKSFALGLKLPLIEVDHLKAHILSHFIDDKKLLPPKFPFLCLTVSGGHTMILKINSYSDMQLLGQTLDDAAGEAFDKAAKIMGMEYPGGPLIDKLAQKGDSEKYSFPISSVPDLNYSFSGLKTAFLYFIRDRIKENPNFIEENKTDICASLQYIIAKTLMGKLIIASKQTNIKRIAIAGGVSANSELRKALQLSAKNENWNIFIPKLEYSTDNAAMIAVTAYYKYLQKDFASQNAVPYTRSNDSF